MSRTYRLPLSKLKAAQRALGAATATEAIERALDLYPSDLLFVHRDAENQPPEWRRTEIHEALATLRFTPRAAARLIEKVLRSAVANAENNHRMRNLDDLRVVGATADGGPSMKRVSPRAMGRAFFIKHRTSHLTIAVSDETETRAAGRRLRRPRAKASHAPTADKD